MDQEIFIGILSTTWLRVPSINLTNAFDCIIKALQNPVWIEELLMLSMFRGGGGLGKPIY